MREIGCAASAHESLKPNCAGIRQFFHGGKVNRRQTTPKREVQDRLCLSTGTLPRESFSVQSGRGGIQGHFKEGGSSTRRQRTRPAREPFPMLAPRFIEMNVRIDESRKQMQS